MSYQFCGVITHPSPKPTALMELLALKPLLEITPCKACSQEDTFHCRINCNKFWLCFFKEEASNGLFSEFSWATQSAETPWRQAHSHIPTTADGFPDLGVPKLEEMLRMDNPDQFRGCKNTQEDLPHSGGVVFPFSYLSPHLAKAM